MPDCNNDDDRVKVGLNRRRQAPSFGLSLRWRPRSPLRRPIRPRTTRIQNMVKSSRPLLQVGSANSLRSSRYSFARSIKTISTDGVGSLVLTSVFRRSFSYFGASILTISAVVDRASIISAGEARTPSSSSTNTRPVSPCSEGLALLSRGAVQPIWQHRAQ